VSCIVAIRHSRGVLLAADSACVDGSCCTSTRKLFRVGRVWLGLAGTFEGFDRVLVDAGSGRPGRDLRSWVADRVAWCQVVDGIAVCGRRAVAWNGGDSAWDVANYTAIGSGNAVALGALHATDGMPPSERALAALRASAAHAVNVRGPFVLVQGTRERTIE
jgi:ATP-dependent protease HslVU (ClpYQ) peptidase subunit